MNSLIVIGIAVVFVVILPAAMIAFLVLYLIERRKRQDLETRFRQDLAAEVLRLTKQAERP